MQRSVMKTPKVRLNDLLPSLYLAHLAALEDVLFKSPGTCTGDRRSVLAQTAGRCGKCAGCQFVAQLGEWKVTTYSPVTPP